MEKTANKPSVLQCTPFQEVDKLVSACQDAAVRVHSPEEMLFVDLELARSSHPWNFSEEQEYSMKEQTFSFSAKTTY